MIEYKTGDIFREDAEAIVNTVNCVGVMGRGIALQFKKQFPENFRAYETACKKKEVIPGKMFVYETAKLINPKYIINFPTKQHWRSASRMVDIEAGLNDLLRVIREKHIRSIALPPLGCGLGGLNWTDVRKCIKEKLQYIEQVDIIIFEPYGAPEPEKMVKNRKVPAMTPGRAALVELIQRYLNGLLDPFVTLLEVHKLMYFMQEAGESLRLIYRKARYGPYAENLRHVLNAVEGHFISGYGDGGDRPDRQLELVPGAYENAASFLKQHEETRKNLEQVVELVDGFESPFGLELLSTVHWVVTKENTPILQDIISRVHNWNEHKKQFTDRQIRLAIDVLLDKGWISNIRKTGFSQ